MPYLRLSSKQAFVCAGAALFNPQAQAPPLRMPTPVEARHVDTAAENAKRAAAAAGLTGLLPSLDAGSQRLKSGMGLSPTPSPRDEQAMRKHAPSPLMSRCS